jgi:hypothetical protein
MTPGRPIVDQHLLAETAGQSGHDHSCGEIVSSTRLGCDDAYRFRGKLCAAAEPVTNAPARANIAIPKRALKCGFYSKRSR